MRFRVTRTSAFGSEDKPPCTEAVRGAYTAHSYCTLPLDEAMKSDRTAWFRKLENHRPAPGGCVADRPDTPCWFVEFDCLDGLMEFIARHGDVVIQKRSDGVEIEIYDGYRE